MRFIIVIGIAIFSISCSKKTAPTATAEEKPNKVEEVVIDYNKLKYTPATVVDMSELAGCRFMLKLEDGKKLQPSPSLDEVYNVNDLPVWIKYQVKKGAAGICMSGQIVTVTSIAKR